MWRGPNALDQAAVDQLHSWGIYFEQTLIDGAGCYRLGPNFDAALDQTAHLTPHSSAWIAARIRAGYRAYHAPLAASRYMAILNLTADSFSDGGQLLQAEALLKAAHRAKAEGADWLDLGAESTRPGASDIPAQQQLQLLLPALKLLRPLGLPISIDTRSADVARACLEAGAGMINDVSALSDPQMASVCVQKNCPVVLMHMRGTPTTMQTLTDYPDLVGGVADELCSRIGYGLKQGLSGARLLLDPGIGFAKTAEQSRQLLAGVGALRALGLPLLLGPSRKSFLADLLPGIQAADRDCGSAGAAALCAMQGVAILRLHSGAHWDAVRVASGIIRSGAGTLSTATPCTTKD
jgi:dihydropteroate synthase